MKTAEKKSLSEQSKTCFLSCSGDGRNYARGLVDVVCAHGINVVFDVGDNDNWIDTLRHEALGANVVILIITREWMRSIRTRTLLGFLPRQRSLKQRFVFGISFSQFEHLSGLAGLVAGMLLEDQRALSEGPSPAALRYIAQVLQSLDGSPRLTLTKPPRPREERKRSLNEGKLILVGRGEVGKTSLVRRLSEVRKGRRGDVPRVHW